MTAQSIFRIMEDLSYQNWVKEFDIIGNMELEILEQELRTIAISPHVAILPLAVGRPAAQELSALIRSIKAQVYPNYSILCPSDGHYDQSDVVLSPDLIAQVTSTADFVLPLPLGSLLPQHALAHFILALAQVPDAEILYADEDFLQNGRRSKPQFKTDWDPYFILGRNCVGIPALYRSEAIRRANLQNLKSRTVDNLLYALTLRVSAVTELEKIFHIPSILCHRTRETDWCGAEGRQIVSAHLAHKGLSAVEICPAPLAPQWNRVRFRVPDPAPLVSIIVPTRDRLELIGPCVDGILNGTDYPALELLVVDNGSTAPDALAFLEGIKKDQRVRILRDDRPFNYSQLNNFAAAKAKGEILILLNNDTQVLHVDWLTELVSLTCLPGVGVVGAKLMYPDLRIQHAGVSFGPDKTVLHSMRFAQGYEPGPAGELALLRCTSAVTGACLAVRKELYFDVGGLNEKRLRVAYNDVDLCRRIAKKKLAIVWTPFAELLHHESVSRGLTVRLEDVDREASELMALWSMNPEFYDHPDPFHNPQIEFQSECVDFARPPREHRFRFGLVKPRPLPFLY